MRREPAFVHTLSNEETAALEAIEFRGPITVVDTDAKVKEACRYLSEQPLIGFDTETRPAFKPGVQYRVALLQLSTPERCFLFRLCRIRFDRAIQRLLEDEKILKIGAAVDGDLHALQAIRRFQSAGFIDLQKISDQWGIEEKSLRKLSAIVLGKRVSKAQRLSNWEAVQLTDKQLIYAATDAWVCTQIYDRLLQTPKPKRLAPKSEPQSKRDPMPASESNTEQRSEAKPKSNSRSKSKRKQKHQSKPKSQPNHDTANPSSAR